VRPGSSIRLVQAELTPTLAAALRHAALMHNPEFHERQRMRASTSKRRPPMTASVVVEALGRAGVHEFAYEIPPTPCLSDLRCAPLHPQPHAG
jgi:hypothetical protein